MDTILSFTDALSMSGESNRHLLLGNGFSRACRNDLFAYDALFNKARATLSQEAQQAFDVLRTSDFELVMRAIERAADLTSIYEPTNHHLQDDLTADRDMIREALAKTIAGNHPDRPNAIMEEEYRACRRFMSHFDSYYTLNYDLLLYWASRQNDVDELKLKYSDGFHHPESGKAEYVVWDMTDVAGQNAFYLHGGLHFFDAGHEVQKYTWVNSGVPLIDQIREALGMNKFPIYVAEGNSQSKRERVQHSAFLSRGYRSLAERSGSIFVYGVSFSPNDRHILRLIARNKARQVFVSVYGDPTSPENQELMNRAMQLESDREESTRQVPLTVRFFHAASAQVWG